MKLSSDEIRYINLFENITGATAKDCIIDENKVIMVVREGEMGLAIGKKGGNIQRAMKIMSKKIEVIEHSDNPKEFIKNIFKQYRVKNVEIKNNIAHINVDDRDKVSVIGIRGKNIKKAKILAKRHHKINDIVIT